MKRKANSSATELVILALTLMMIFVPCCQTGYWYTGEPETKVIHVVDKELESRPGIAQTRYLIFTEDEQVYSIEDLYLEARFDSSTLAAQVHRDKCYKVRLIGTRVPLFSQYKTIMSKREVKCGEGYSK